MERLLTLLLCVSTTVYLSAAVTSRIDALTQIPVNPVIEGDTVAIWCIGIGNTQRWYINNIISYSFHPSFFTIAHYGDIDNNFWNTSLTFNAMLNKNGTNIRCGLTDDSTGGSTNNITVILAGPPPTPTTMIEDLHEGTVLRLSWTEPFTLAPYSVTSYNVVVYNNTVSTDNMLVNVSLNSTQHHYDFMKPNNSASCLIIVFAVSATSVIGTSNISTEQGVFPMIPEVSDLNIGHEVVFVNGITPRLTVWFQEPKVCPLQEQANYTLEVLDENGHVVHSSGFQEASGGSDGRVVTKFTGLSPNLKVSIRLTIMHSSMSWIQTATEENITIPTLQPPEPPLKTNSPVVTSASDGEVAYSSLSPTTVIIITVVSVGVTILICVIMIVFIAMIIVVNKGRRPVIAVATDFSPGIIPTNHEFKLQDPPKGKNKVPKSLPTMKANPIYDGPMYDSPGGESLKQLLGNSSVPSTPATDYPRYSGMPPPPSLPPPRKTITSSSDLPLPPFPFSPSSTSNIASNDTYTEMKPTSMEGCTISRPPDVLPAVYEAMVGDPVYEVSK